MYYVIRRKGNLFNKSTYEKIFGVNSLEEAVANNEVQKTASGYYKGINNEESRQWRRIPELYQRSGASKYLHQMSTEVIPMKKAKALGIDVSMAVSSGFVLQTDKGLVYDSGQYRPLRKRTEKDFYDRSDDVIAREGNYIPGYIIERIDVDKKLFTKMSGKDIFMGTVDTPISKVLTFENTSLLGIPYIMLDQLYSGKETSYIITEYNLEDVIELIVSGHVIVKGDRVYLDNHEIKRHHFYNWVGEEIYCNIL